MRKVVVEFGPKSFEKLGMGHIFKTVKSLEFKQILRMDFEEGIKVLIEDIEMKPGYELGDMDLPEGIEIVDVMRRDHEEGWQQIHMPLEVER